MVTKLQNYIMNVIFYDHEIHQRKLSVTMSGFITHFVILLYAKCILVIRHPDDRHRGGRNIMVNNIRLNVFINVH